MLVGKIEQDKSRINFWDLGGQKELHSIWEKYYSECHAIVFVVDSTDRERIEDVKETFRKMMSHVSSLEGVITNDEIEGVPVLMLANKHDVTGALKVEEIKEIFNPIAVQLGARDSKVLSISALRGEGVKEAVDWVFIRMQRNKMNRPPVVR